MGFTVEGSHGDILIISHLVYLFIFFVSYFFGENKNVESFFFFFDGFENKFG